MQSFFEEIRSKRKYFPLQRIFSFPLTEMVDKASLYFISEAVEWPFLLWYVTFTSGLCSAIPPEDAGAHLRSPCVLRGVAKDISVVSQTFFFLSLLYLWKDSSGVFFSLSHFIPSRLDEKETLKEREGCFCGKMWLRWCLRIGEQKGREKQGWKWKTDGGGAGALMTESNR